MTVSPALYVLDLMRFNWNANNTSGITPDFQIIYEVRKDLVRQSTVTPAAIYVMEGVWRDEYVDFRRDFLYRYYPVTVDIRLTPTTQGGDLRSVLNLTRQVLDEMRRICHSARKLPDIARNIPTNSYGTHNPGFTHIYLGKFNNLSNRTIRLFRYVADIELRTVVEATDNF